MLRKGGAKWIGSIAVICFAALLVAIFVPADLDASYNAEHNVVVSLGDSYSSGEGIEPYYGQSEGLIDKYHDEDWLSHRSKLSWPGMLIFPGFNGQVSSYKDQYWFFKAVSGATTEHLTADFANKIEGVSVPAQLNVFDNLKPGIVSYVTITIGGNDVGFANIMTTCALNGDGQGTGELQQLFDDLWEAFGKEGGTRYKISQAYKEICERAGAQACVLVVGYPRLLSTEKQKLLGKLYSAEEVRLVNENVTRFNDALSEIVETCRREGANIWFVSVEDSFTGHEAYSDTPYINGIVFVPSAQDLSKRPPSAASFHPNEKGAEAYRECVQTAIDELVKSEMGEEGAPDYVLGTGASEGVPLEGRIRGFVARWLAGVLMVCLIFLLFRGGKGRKKKWRVE